MKQRITCGQLNELTEIQQAKLREWWKPQEGDSFKLGEAKCLFDSEDNDNRNFFEAKVKHMCLPLLSIGQMIELLYQAPEGRHRVSRIFGSLAGEQCDRLWEAVKEAL